MDKLFMLHAPCVNAVQFRRKKYEGKMHLVFPVILLKEGVHNGSAGPTYYPAEELAKYPAAWNGIPVPVFHPTDGDGVPSIANSPETIEKHSVGWLFNVFYDDEAKALKGEVWINEKKVKQVNPAVLDILLGDGFLDVSTGLFADGDGVGGTWGDETYNETARNYRPEHLALLPGMKGACSWEDGCGIRANCDSSDDELCPCKLVKAADEIQNEQSPEKLAQFTANEKPLIEALMHKLASSIGYKAMAMSHSDIHNTIEQALRKENSNDGGYIWLRDVFKSLIVYERGGESSIGTSETLYQRSYTLEGETITLGDDIVEVKQEINYIPVTNKEDEMNKEKFIQGLIDNEATEWAIDDKETLMALSECQLKKLDVKTPDPVTIPEGAKADIDGKPSTYTNGAWVEDAPVDNHEDDKPVTMAEFLAAAPEGIREVLTNGVQMVQAEKNALIAGIMANEASIFTEDALKSKGVGELKAIAALARGKKEGDTTDYSGGAGGNLHNQQDKAPEGNVMPTINWEK